MVQDQNGNHVIQKCFECFAPAKTECIIDQIIANVPSVPLRSTS